MDNSRIDRLEEKMDQRFDKIESYFIGNEQFGQWGIVKRLGLVEKVAYGATGIATVVGVLLKLGII